MNPLIFQAIVGCKASIANAWAMPIHRAMVANSINTPNRQAMFMAQMMVESGDFTVFEENLNYGADGLAETWPSRYAANPGKTPKVPNDLARQIARKPQAIANHTYANRMGNGPVSSGDGWRYRGRGPKQITGRNNYAEMGEVLGLDLIGSPDLLLEVQHGAASAGAFWARNGCNELADKMDYRGVTRAINGGLIGYAMRVLCLNRACAAMNLPKPSVPMA